MTSIDADDCYRYACIYMRGKDFFRHAAFADKLYAYLPVKNNNYVRLRLVYIMSWHVQPKKYYLNRTRDD